MTKPQINQEIQGLRAVSIIMVVVLHYLVIYRAELLAGSPFHQLIYRLSSVGWIGVDIFFAISGFVVTQVLLRSNGGTYSGFMWNRAKRLLPAYFGLLVVAVCLAAAPFDTGVSASFGFTTLWAWLGAANVAAAYSGGLLDGGNINLVHLWSLCVEFQFYAIWPFLVWRLDGRTRIAAMVAVAAVALGLRTWASFVDLYYNAIYSLTFFRMDAFAFGGIAALCVDKKRASSLAFWVATALLVSVVTYLASTLVWHKTDPVVQTVGYSIIGAGAALLVLALFEGRAPRNASKFLRSHFMTWIGDRSYSIYLWHIPFHRPIDTFIMSLSFGNGTARAATSIVINTCVSLILAEISYRLLERRRSSVASDAVKDSNPR